MPGMTPTTQRAVVFETPGADPATDRWVRDSERGRTTVVAVADASQLVPVALELADAGATLIELCGGIGVPWRARVASLVHGRALVSSVTYAIDSLAPAARYSAAYEAGEVPSLAFLLLEPGSDPDTDRVVFTPESIPTPLVPVPDAATAVAVAARLAAEGTLLIELYGGFDSTTIGEVIEAVDGRAAVGAGSFAIDAVAR